LRVVIRFTSVSDSIKAFVIRAGGAGLAFALQACLARLMNVQDYGQFVMIWAWTLALGSFASLGLAEMALRVLPRYALRSRARLVADFVSHGFRTTATVAVAVSALALFIATQLPLSRELLLVIAGVCVTLPLLGLDFFLGGVSRAMGWVQLGIITTYIVRPLLVLAFCAALWWAGVALTGVTVTGVVVVCLAITTLFLRIIMHRRLKGSDDKPTSPTLRRFWLKQSMPMLLASGLDDVLGYADVVLVGLLLSPAETAVYFVASRVLMPASLVQYAFFYVAARRFSLALADASPAEVKQDFWRSTGLTLAACTAAVAATLVIAPFLLKIFGPTFETAMPLVLVLAVSQIAKAAGTQAQEYLMVAGQATSVSWINAVAFVVMIISVALIGTSFGAVGIAWCLAGALGLRSLMLLKHGHSHVTGDR
jgi:O-antigen/teichoic acid export membrane protein